MMNPLLARDYEVPKRPIFLLEGRDVVQRTDASAFVSNSVTDSVMYGTNGHIGLRHLSETETVGFETEVLMNGIYHEVPVDIADFKGMPKTMQVGASICTVDLDCILDGESGTLSSIPTRKLNLDDGAYRSVCRDVMSADGGLIFDTEYVRTVGIQHLGTWGAEVRYSNFRIGVMRSPNSNGEDSNSGTSPATIPGGPLIGSYAGHNRSLDSVSDILFNQPASPHGVLRVQHDLNYRIEFTVLIRIDPEQWKVQHSHMDQIHQCSTSSAEEVSTLTDVSCTVRFGDSYRVLEDDLDYGPWSSEMDIDFSSPFSRERYSSISGGGGREVASNYSNEGKDPSASSAFVHKNGWNYDGFNAANKSQKTYILKKRFVLLVTPDSVPNDVVLTFRACHTRGGDTALLASLPTITDMIAEQRASLAPFWKTFDADVKMQDELTPNRSRLSLLYNAFRLFMVSHGVEGGLSRSGLSAAGDGLQFNLSEYIYYGMYYMLTQPEACLSLLKSYYHMLPQSRKYARTLALRCGAIFPLTTISGVHCTHFANMNNARFHVNSELGFLISLYADAVETISVEDRLILLELMLESVRVWALCGEWQDAHTSFRLENIAGTDEYNSNSSGNFYVHISARRHLTAALTFLDSQRKYIGEQQLADLLYSIEMPPEEIEELRAVERGIVVPQRHEQLGVYLVHDNFDTLPEWSGGRAVHPLSLNYHPLDIYRRKLIDVPEVLLGLLMYPDEFEQSDFERNFDYYYPLCTFDSPVSLFLMLFAHCRARRDLAQPIPFLRSLANIDLDNIIYAAEGGLHFSAMATALQGLIFGCGGVQCFSSGLHVNPILPAGIDSYHFMVTWRGSVLKVSVDCEHFTYDLVSGDSIRFIHGKPGQRIHLHSGFQRCEEVRHLVIPRPRLSHVAQFDGAVLLADCLFNNLLEYSYRSWFKTLETLFDTYRVLHNRPIPSLNPEEFIEKVVYQTEEREIAFSGIHEVLLSRGINLELGTPEDAEIVETRYGLANAKVAEMSEMLAKDPPQLNIDLLHLLCELVRNGVTLAIISYSRILKQLMTFNPPLAKLFVAMIDGEEAHDRRIKGRPHLDLYIRAAEKIHVDPSRCLAFSHHLDRGYTVDHFSQFRLFLDVEDPFVSSRFPPCDYPKLSDAQVAEMKRDNPVVCRLELQRIPTSIDEIEDLVDGRRI